MFSTTNIILVVVAILALTAGLRAGRFGQIVGGVACLLAISAIGWDEHVRQERMRQAIEDMKKEISPAQYITLAAMARQDATSRDEVRRAIADGRVSWNEYGPIERSAAQRFATKARDDARIAAGYAK
jgi:hypothetical protein